MCGLLLDYTKVATCLVAFSDVVTSCSLILFVKIPSPLVLSFNQFDLAVALSVHALFLCALLTSPYLCF